jgi:hypothetical protein
MTGLTGSACRSSAFAALAASVSLVWPTLPAQADTYVFSTFTGDNAPGEKLSTYQSDDALHFTLVPDGGIGAPSISNTGFGGPSGYLRDPSILKYTDGKYYVTYTDPLSQPCCGEENHFSVASSSEPGRRLGHRARLGARVVRRRRRREDRRKHRHPEH